MDRLAHRRIIHSAQVRDHPLPGTTFGAVGLDQLPVIMRLAVLMSTLPTEKHRAANIQQPHMAPQGGRSALHDL